MEKIAIQTQKRREIIDITEMVAKNLRQSGGKSGAIHLFLLHTTAALTIADLDPGTDMDLLDAFRELVPKLKYRHPHDPAHVSDHILSSLIGTQLVVPVADGNPVLGTWQRIILAEFDGPRKRELAVSFLPER